MAVKKYFGNVIVKSMGERRASMRTLRPTATGAIPRYINVPRNVSSISKVRSSLYTFSVAAGDITSMIPGKFMPKIRNNSLSIARTLGDFSAIRGTVARLSGTVLFPSLGMPTQSAIGRRFGRRMLGRGTGAIVKSIPGDNPLSRAVRSKMAAEFQRQQNKLFNKGHKTVVIKGKGNIVGPTANRVMQDSYEDFLWRFGRDFMTEVQKYTPIKTGALIRSIQVMNSPIAADENEIAVTMGNREAYYAPAVEYGRGGGYTPTIGGLPSQIAPAPRADVSSRLINYKGYQPSRAPMRKGAISITNKYRGILKEQSGRIDGNVVHRYYRNSIKGVFGK